MREIIICVPHHVVHHILYTAHTDDAGLKFTSGIWIRVMLDRNIVHIRVMLDRNIVHRSMNSGHAAFVPAFDPHLYFRV